MPRMFIRVLDAKRTTASRRTVFVDEAKA